MALLVLAGASAFLLLIATPIFVAILAPTVLSFDLFGPGIPTMVLVQQMVQGINKFSLLAVPLFIFAAAIISRGEIGARLLDMVESFLGHLTGGVAIATVVTCGLFEALSGVGQAAIVSIGPIVFPLLLKQGYSKGFAVGLILSASTLSMLVPPSVAMILYCLMTMSSVGNAFLGGLAAGVVFTLVLSLYAYLYARFKGIRGSERKPWSLRFKSLRNAFWALGMPIIIFGGIYSGVFTPTEAAAGACAYAIVVECLVYRTLSFRDLFNISESSANSIAALMILLTAGAVLSYFLTILNVPQDIAAALEGRSYLGTLLLINLMFLVAGMFIDPNSTIIILTPLVLPTVAALGIDPIHLGAIVVLNIAIGMVTPPFGINIFVAIITFDVNYFEAARSVWPFVLVALVTLVIVTAFPSLILWLPETFGVG